MKNKKLSKVLKFIFQQVLRGFFLAFLKRIDPKFQGLAQIAYSILDNIPNVLTDKEENNTEQVINLIKSKMPDLLGEGFEIGASTLFLRVKKKLNKEQSILFDMLISEVKFIALILTNNNPNDKEELKPFLDKLNSEILAQVTKVIEFEFNKDEDLTLTEEVILLFLKQIQD